jgi:hypothetical protein
MEKRSDESIKRDVDERKSSFPPTEIIEEERNSTWHLNPRPSTDPADPLNWPMALKVGNHFTYSH